MIGSIDSLNEPVKKRLPLPLRLVAGAFRMNRYQELGKMLPCWLQLSDHSILALSFGHMRSSIQTTDIKVTKRSIAKSTTK